MGTSSQLTFWSGLAAGAVAASSLLLVLHRRSARQSDCPFMAAKQAATNKATKVLAHKSQGEKPVLTLHIYDHCPFCVRIELVLGWMGIPYTRRVFGYGDIDGPTKLFGVKMLPVLEMENGEFMRESGDIIAYLESLRGVANRLLPPATNRFADWIKNSFRPYKSPLARKAVMDMPVADWASKADVDYAVNKYTNLGFDYAAAETNAPELRKNVEKALLDLVPMLASAASANAYGLSWDDIMLLPELRALGSVKGIEWPPLVRAYVNHGMKDCQALNYMNVV